MAPRSAANVRSLDFIGCGVFDLSVAEDQTPGVLAELSGCPAAEHYGGWERIWQASQRKFVRWTISPGSTAPGHWS